MILPGYYYFKGNPEEFCKAFKSSKMLKVSFLGKQIINGEEYNVCLVDWAIPYREIVRRIEEDPENAGVVLVKVD